MVYGILGLLLAASASYAQEVRSKRFELHGFGTLALDYHDEKGLEYRRSTSQAHGVAAGELNFKTDSALGLQANMTFWDDLQLIVQAITRQNGEGNWAPRVVRTFVSYRPAPNILLRGGRIGYDSYLLAESPSVGFSYLPIRPAPEFFGLFASDDIDGVDVAVTRPAGEGIAGARVLLGNTYGEQVYQPGSVVRSRSDLLGLQLDYMYRQWLVRTTALGARLQRNSDLTELANALRATGVPQSIELADRLQSDERMIYAYQIAAAYDGRPLQGQILLTRIDSELLTVPRVNSGVAVLGYRYRKLTPFVSFATVKSFADIHPTGLPDVPWFAALNAGARTVQTAAQATQRTHSIGVRYDVTPRWDFKFQVDRVLARESNLIFDDRGAGAGRSQLTLFGVSVDFAF